MTWLLCLTIQESEDSLSQQNQIIGFLESENRRDEGFEGFCPDLLPYPQILTISLNSLIDYYIKAI